MGNDALKHSTTHQISYPIRHGLIEVRQMPRCFALWSRCVVPRYVAAYSDTVCFDSCLWRWSVLAGEVRRAMLCDSLVPEMSPVHLTVRRGVAGLLAYLPCLLLLQGLQRH